MSPDALAALHAAAFTVDRPWTASEFECLLDNPHTTLLTRPGQGFALVRTIAKESELLTLAVDPSWQGHGIGRALVEEWIARLPRRVERAFLEVAADNTPALALYRRCGFAQIACRASYYARAGAADADALILSRELTRDHPLSDGAHTPEIG
jgi:ribosomal-protein-alanine N-acetyltransferase